MTELRETDAGIGSKSGAGLRISIVVPNYNGAAFIEETLKSVVDQNYPGLELIVVDGASKDDSLTIIERFRTSIARLIVEPDKGHADALNKGFAAATGDILGWINSDDILLPNCLSFIDKLFRRRPDIEWITGRPSSMDEEGRIGWVGPLRPWSRLRFLSGDSKWIQQESTFWRKSLWDKAGGSLDLRYSVANDFDLWRRFFRHADLHSVDRHLGCFRIREGQRSIKFRDLYEREMQEILDQELQNLDPDFRNAFDLLLPQSAKAALSPTTISADPRYAICDPAIVTSGEALGWTKSAVRPNAAKYGMALAPSNLSTFRNRHKGERCFIMGNGPSLNNTNLSLLEDETVFACNAAFLLFNRISWRPKYYACVDSRVLPDRAPEIDAMLKSNPQMHGFFPALLQEHSGEGRKRATRMILPSAHNRWYFSERPNSESNPPHSMFSYDINEAVVQPFTVAITMLQIAAYMGFSEIILIGCDTEYVVPDTAKRDESGIALTSTANDDANHFDAAYFGRGRKWHDPQTDKMLLHYKYAKEALDAIGVNVFNATVGGKLEIFPRRRLEDFFGDGAARATAGVSPRLAAPVPAAAKLKAADRLAPLLAVAAGRRKEIGIFSAALAAVTLTAAALGETPAAKFVLFGGAVLLLGGGLVAVAMKMRGYVLDLSRQISDISNGAGRASEGAVISKLAIEDEIARLHDEVERLKQELASRG